MIVHHRIRTTPQNSYNSGTLDQKSQWYQKFWYHCHRFPLLPSDKPYDITISHQFRFIWFRNYKVGSRSVLNLFRKNHVILDAGQPYQCYYPPKKYNDYFAFAFVRNPWDRLISCWHDKVLKYNHFRFSDSEWEKMKQLENFITYIQKINLSKNVDGHIRLQSSLIDLNHLEFLGRYESFHDDMLYIMKRLQLEIQDVPKRNTSERQDKDYPKFLTPETAEMTARLYEKDVRIFGYSF